MDAVQTSVETPTQTMVEVVELEDTGVPIEEQVDTSEMGELPVEEQVDTSEMGELPVEDWDYQRPRRGEVRTGVIMAIREQEIIVDVGAKRDGIVPYADMQRMGAEALADFSVGDQVPVYVLRPEDQDGNLLVSLFLARQAQAWTDAQELFESGQVWEEQAIGYNKGGLVVPVGEIRGFVPASQVPGFPRGLNQEERLTHLSGLVGETLQVKIIEINRRKRRLILSATAAQQQWRKQQREQLLSELREGEVRKGVVSSLANFGAFVDLGGADGLVHLSELSWRRIRHPREAVRVGQEVEVYVLRLDHERNRIGLSLKRLQPEPWALIEEKYELGQLIEGVVTNVVDFGAFAEVEEGVEGLIHISELADTSISDPRDVVKKGDLLLLRIIRIDTRRKRLGLSLKRVLESEWAEWAANLAADDAWKKAQADESVPPAAEEAEEAVAAAPETPVEESISDEPAAAEPEEPVAAALETPVEELALDEPTAVEPEEAVAAAPETPVEEQISDESTAAEPEDEEDLGSAEFKPLPVEEEPEAVEGSLHEAEDVGEPADSPDAEAETLGEPETPSVEDPELAVVEG
jgi:small subunit ribosomal protein S1